MNEQLDNTIIVIIGDHGEEFNEFGRFGHSFSFKNVIASIIMCLLLYIIYRLV